MSVEVMVYPSGWPRVRATSEPATSERAGRERVATIRATGGRAELLVDGATVSTGCGCTCIPECVTWAEHERGDLAEVASPGSRPDA